MATHTAPIFRLNADCFELLFQNIAELDWLQKVERFKQHDHSPQNRVRRPALEGPNPLHAFSMTCGYIRQLALPIIFKSVHVRLDCYYKVEGVGIKDVDLGGWSMDRVLMFPGHIWHARSLSIRMPPMNHPAFKPPRLIPFAIYSLIGLPQTLRRLYIEASYPIIKGITEAADRLSFHPNQILELVEELVVPKGGEFFVERCPNTKRLGILEETRERTEDGNIILRSASHLPKLMAIHLTGAWTDSGAGRVLEYCPNIKELHCTGIWGVGDNHVDAIRQAIFGFPHLRRVGMCAIHRFIRRLRSGEEVPYPHTVEGHYEDALRKWEEARREMAAGLLGSGNTSLDSVEIRWGNESSQPVIRYVRDSEDAEEGGVRVAGSFYGPFLEQMDWVWHPATVSSHRE